jgi:hypothetical protein
MFRRRNKPSVAILAACAWLACAATPGLAWQTMNMPGVENSAGFLASGTSIEPRTTSESSPMLHGSLGNWTVMFHGNAFLADIQQTGPRGRDKLFSANWVMPMLTRIRLLRSAIICRIQHTLPRTS